MALVVSLCHGPGLVDADVLSFMRCGVIVLDVSVIVVSPARVWMNSFVLSVPRFGFCVGE